MKWHDAKKEWPPIKSWGFYLFSYYKNNNLIEEKKEDFHSDRVLLRVTEQDEPATFYIGYWNGEWQTEESVPFEYRKQEITHWCYFVDIPLPNEKHDEVERDENGYIKRTCMRPKCGQSLWVREYQNFTKEHPLLCKECWFSVKCTQELLVHTEKAKDLFEAHPIAIKMILKDS